MNSIEEMSVVAVGQRLRDVFNLPTTPIECPANDRVHTYHKLAGRKGDEVTYPIVAYSVTTLSEGDTASPTAMLYQGVKTTLRTDTIGSLSCIPCKMSVDVTYLDTDRTRVLAFMSKWFRAGAAGLLNFRLRVDGVPIDIQLTPDPNLSAPQRDMSLDVVANVYELTGTLGMRTYLSGPFAEAIKQVTRLKEIGVNAILPTAPSPASLAYNNALAAATGMPPKVPVVDGMGFPLPPSSAPNAAAADALALGYGQVAKDNFLFDIRFEVQPTGEVNVVVN